MAVCVACNGWGKYVIGLVQHSCSVCKGTGATPTDAEPEAKFKVGDPVEKFGGDYQATGEIVAVAVKRSGVVRYVVEYDHPAGLLHIHSASQLRIRVTL